MAKKKKAAKKSSKRKNGKSKMGMGSFVDTNKLIGMAAGAFANSMVKKIPGTANLNPKILSAAKIIGGQYLPNLPMAKNALANDSMRNGFGDALIYEGVKELMAGFGIAGMRNMARRPKGNEFLAVSIEGLEDAGAVSEDILAADEYDIGEDDLSAVNEDILGGDDIDAVNEDILGDDDLSAVNDDMLSEDELGEDEY